ncbi:unnamed protein product [Dracunculus medinensis]|uniref:NUC153 domain-containing protein n=1 Tax=Dracunculus medinensis TaxID=318479 RepID=A0A0N4UGF7_DRAME|nr:unnamed protein product [Dracunculus medinensis]
MDNWGCVDEANLFSSSYGKIEPLVRLVESLDSSDYDDLKYNQIFSANLDQNVEIVPYKEKIWATKNKSILKKETKMKDNEQLEQREKLDQHAIFKKVTFAAEKLAADECSDNEERDKARSRLAVKLGAKPLKRKYINYKELKKELALKKAKHAEEIKHSTLNALKSAQLNKKKKNNNKKVKKGRK